MEFLSGVVVVAIGVYLVGLAVVIALEPRLAGRFLESFASSARAHFTEQTLRLIAGGAMVFFAPSMWFPDLFNIFGWLMVVTAGGLLLMPWMWHRAFAKWAIPVAIRHMKFVALGASALAILIFYGVSRALLS